MGNTILPGIKKVEYCLATELLLQNNGFLQEGDTVSPEATFYDMEIIGLGKGELTGKIEEGEWMYETKISFFAKEATPVKEFLCYRITTVNGESYLLGTDSRPFVIREYKRTLPNDPLQKQGCDVTLTYKNKHSLLLIEN